MKTLIVIAGPTASGKTDLAIQVAQHFQTEIISADSRQCYQEMNIGVAKPSEQQLQTVPHHFINSHSIHDTVSAGLYERYALAKLEKIYTTNEVAVCVGGTGMYMNALCQGIDEMPEVDPIIYQAIETNYQERGIEWLQKQLQESDPLFFSKGETQNPTRLLRALSFLKTNGVSIVQYQQHTAKQRSFNILKYAIDIERPLLYDRINSRVEQMMEDGLLDEVKCLHIYKHLKCLNTVGYTELFSYLEAEQDLNYCVDKIKQHTRNYAKRQITWFKHQGDFCWMSADSILQNATSISL